MFRPSLYALPVLAIFVAATIAPSSAQAPLTVTSITPKGVKLDGRYHVDLKGTFASPSDVVVEAVCDGRLTPNAVHSATDTTIEISLPLQRGPTRCGFVAHRLTDGALSGPSIRIDSPDDDEIVASVDRGSIGTRHGLELYGTFPHSQSLNLSVHCIQGGDINRTHAPYTPDTELDLRSPKQINLTFKDVQSLGARCSFTPTDAASGRPIGPRWGPIAIYPNDAYVMAGFGAYHWPLGASVAAGADDALMSGQHWVARAGFTVGRIWMAPLVRQRGDNANNPYHLNLDILEDECPVIQQAPGSDCNASPPFLPCAARSSAYQRFFSFPNLTYVVLTVADSASSGDNGSVSKLRDPAWFQNSDNKAKVVKEYRDLALALYETQRDSGKHFIVSNWETDNAIYDCGSTPCTNAVIDATFKAFTEWFRARQQGILDARAIAQSRGITGVTVSDAIEFNRIRDSGLKVIDDIIPIVMPEYMTYSAWGSSGGGPTNDPDAGGQLDRDLIRLAERFPRNRPQLIIGELGPGNYTGEDPDTSRGKNDAWQMAQNARAVQRAQLPATILWSAYDNAPDQDGNLLSEGVLSADGRERHVIERIRAELLAGSRELLGSPSSRIGGIIVTKALADGAEWDLFEMFVDRGFKQGRFPDFLAGMVVRCSYTCTGPTCIENNMVFDSTEIPDSLARPTFSQTSDFHIRVGRRNWNAGAPSVFRGC